MAAVEVPGAAGAGIAREDAPDPALDPGAVAVARRIMDRCNLLATYSDTDTAIERVFLSPEHRRVNRTAATWMREAGLRTWQDQAGNQCGRMEGARPGLPALLLGSHLDTVPDAGRYDGILGVLLAIEVVRRFRAEAQRLPFALETIAFSDEEGTRFGTALFGSRAVAGTLGDDWAQVTDRDGVSIPEAARQFGLDPEEVGLARRRPESLVGYLEAHIEQRPFLERSGRALGVVTGIAGAKRMLVRIEGESRHAGTPYDLRRDALLGAAAAITRIQGLAEDAGDSATIGRLRVSPDAVNIVPGLAEFSLDYRSESDAKRDAGIERALGAVRSQCAERGLTVTVQTWHEAETVSCARSLQDVVAEAIGAVGDDAPMRLFSVAGHDAMSMASITDVAMLFIRCRQGISHNPGESVTLEDAARAFTAYVATVADLEVRLGGRS
jgi:allantoate deiminase